MKQSISNLICIVSVLMIVSGCRSPRPADEFKWPQVDPATDSLTQELDRAFFHRVEDDTLRELTAQLHGLAEKRPDNVELHGRDLYYQAALLLNYGDLEHRDSLIELAKSSIDSASHPYLYHRLDFLADEMRELSLEQYNRIRTRLDFFESVGDNVMAGSQYTELGNLLRSINYPSEAVKAYDKADSLYRLTGFNDVRVGNSINRSSVLSDLRDTVGSLAILTELCGNPEVTSRPVVLSMVLNNIYDLTRDPEIVYELQRLEGNTPRIRTLIFLSDEETKKGNYRMGLVYADSAFREAYDNDFAQDMAFASLSAARAFEGLHMPDSAFYRLDRGTSILNEIEQYTEQENIVDAEIVDAIARQRLEAELESNKKLLRLVCVSALLVALLLAAGWITASRIERLRSQRRELELRRRDMSRRLMDTQIAMDESQQLISSVRKEINDMADSGDITDKASRPIVSAIKSYEVQQGQSETFIESFASVHPQFGQRMHEINPAFTEPDIRLASYIVMGMDTKHIATTMGIRPESVKQGRWRLRTKLGLHKGDSLEDALRALLN